MIQTVRGDVFFFTLLRMPTAPVKKNKGGEGGEIKVLVLSMSPSAMMLWLLLFCFQLLLSCCGFWRTIWLYCVASRNTVLEVATFSPSLGALPEGAFFLTVLQSLACNSNLQSAFQLIFVYSLFSIFFFFNTTASSVLNNMIRLKRTKFLVDGYKISYEFMALRHWKWPELWVSVKKYIYITLSLFCSRRRAFT